MLTAEQLRRAAGETGFTADSLEKAWMLVGLLDLMRGHPFLGPRIALKGGTALNLFVFDVPRLSVDIDVNYIGSADRETMEADRPKIAAALGQAFGRLGMAVKRSPTDHAGGKWRVSYSSVLGRPAVLEVDVNFMLRVPLWPPVDADSRIIIDRQARSIALLDDHELAAGKLAALMARGASRDLFDSREVLLQSQIDVEKLRLAFVVYGGINRRDWRTISVEDVTSSVSDVKRNLLPMLHRDVRPPQEGVDDWTTTVIRETRELLGRVLPLKKGERAFLDRLNDHGEIEPELLTSDRELAERIRLQPGLQWKALNVRKHRGV